MSQKCSECGRETPLGQNLQHYWGCEHDATARSPPLSQMGRGQQQAQIGKLLGSSMCGGCGNDDPDKRCLGCLHDFGRNGAGVKS